MKIYVVKCIACREDDEYGHYVFLDSYIDVFDTKFDAEFAIELFKEKLDRDYYWHTHVSTFEIIEKEI
jgi:hypothetical protein